MKKLTLEQAKAMMEKNGGSLDLEGCTWITSLPDNLTVGGYLYLGGCTGITSLPDNLTVGGSLDLEGCTWIKEEKRRKVKKLRNGDYVEGRYLYADDILTHIKGCRKVGEHIFYIGKIKGRNVVSDGVHYAHCKKLRDGIADLMFKTASDRGAEQYKGMSLDDIVTLKEAVTMYRIITGACRQGSESFVSSLGDKVKEQYTVRECIEITQGQYGHEAFRRFWDENA